MHQFQNQEEDKTVLKELLEEAFKAIKLDLDLLLICGNRNNVTLKAYA
jgi:hypothetical protein